MSAKPEIIVSTDDYNRLHALLENLPDNSTVERLIDELERATVVATETMPEDVVRMQSRVVFTVLSTRKTFTYRLVYPHETTGENTLSILTPVGSALLGLSVGQEIEWPLESGKSTLVRIDSVPKE